MPHSQGLCGAMLVLAALIGSQAGTMSNLSYAYFATEKGWRGAEDLGRQRRDLLAGTACKFGIGALLQIAAAATLLPLGIRPESAQHLVRIFSEHMGLAGKLIFGAGLWAICFSNYVSGTIGYALITRDICRRFVPGLKVEEGSPVLRRPSKDDAVYRWAVAVLALSPLYVVFLGVEPLALALTVRSAVVVVIPILVASLMRLTNDRALMGAHRTGWAGNLAMGLLVLASAYLSYRNAAE